VLPNFVGQAPPCNDDKDTRQLYCTSMLMLLKLWRSLEMDLKHAQETWDEAFTKFSNNAPKDIRNLVSNIQYFHECKTAAHLSAEVQMEHVTHESIEMEEDIPRTEVIPNDNSQAVAMTEILTREDIHAQLAVEKAKQARVFDDENLHWDITGGRHARVGLIGDLNVLQDWKAQMEGDVNAINQATLNNSMGHGEGDMSGMYGGAGAPGARVIPLSELENQSRSVTHPTIEIAEQALTSIDPSMLKDDQHWAYNIITWHLDQTLGGTTPPPSAFNNPRRRRHWQIQSHPNCDRILPVPRRRAHATQGSLHRHCSLAYRRQNDPLHCDDKPDKLKSYPER